MGVYDFFFSQQFSRLSKASGWECSEKSAHIHSQLSAFLHLSEMVTLSWQAWRSIVHSLLHYLISFPLFQVPRWITIVISSLPFNSMRHVTLLQKKILAKAICYGNSDIPLQDQLCCWISVEWNHVLKQDYPFVILQWKLSRISSLFSKTDCMRELCAFFFRDHLSWQL